MPNNMSYLYKMPIWFYDTKTKVFCKVIRRNRSDVRQFLKILDTT